MPAALSVFADESALAPALAECFIESAARAIAQRGRFDVALAGGSTPKAAYALLASAPRRERVAWKAVRFFFGDERCVAPTDDRSNFKMASQALLDPLGIPSERVFRISGEIEPRRAAHSYERALVQELGPGARLDLIMLGMGPEGHTASIFPGSQALTNERDLVVAVYVEKVAMYRITLTPPTINAAREIVIAAAGDAKAIALARAVDGPYDSNITPIQAVKPVEGVVRWLVDRAAAAKLSAAPKSGVQ